MKITLPRFYQPEPDPEERPVAIMPEDLSPEALRHLLDLAGYELTEAGERAYPCTKTPERPKCDDCPGRAHPRCCWNFRLAEDRTF